MEITSVSILELPRIFDDRGNLSFIEAQRHVPFKIARAYWIYDVPGGEKRGGHAFKRAEEFIVALSGSFNVSIDDGNVCSSFFLNRSYKGLYIPPMHWRVLDDFSTNAVCLVLSSIPYDESDYVYNFEDFKLIVS